MHIAWIPFFAVTVVLLWPVLPWNNNKTTTLWYWVQKGYWNTSHKGIQIWLYFFDIELQYEQLTKHWSSHSSSILSFQFHFLLCTTSLVELISYTCICSWRRTLRPTQPNWGNWITSVITYPSWGPSYTIQQTSTCDIYL